MEKEMELRAMSDAQLEKLLKETSSMLNRLEEEQGRRKVENKKLAWENLVDAMRDYCAQYGCFAVTGNSWEYKPVIFNVTVDCLYDTDIGRINIEKREA